MSYSSYTVSNQSSLEEDITNHTTIFGPWRFSANDQTLLFNFKKNIQTEDEAISILIQHYGTENIRFARRTIPNKVPVAIWNRYYSNRNSINDSYKENDLLIEVLFHRKSIRHDALCFGVKHKDIIYLPWTTCSFEHTHAYAVTLYGLPPTTEAKADSLILSFCKDFMFKFETMERLPPVDQGMAYIRHVWLHKVSDVYCGSATVILHNVDERLAKPIREIVTFDTPYDGVPSYPDIRTFIQPCFMYCDQCRTFNMHKTKDCVIFDIINLQGNTHAYNEYYKEHGLNEKFQLS